MKKKFREITVDGVTYGWLIRNKYSKRTVEIWLNKQVIFERDIEYNDKNGNNIEITPSRVERIIKNSLKLEEV